MVVLGASHWVVAELLEELCLGSEHSGSATEGQTVEGRYGPVGGRGVGRVRDVRILTW